MTHSDHSEPRHPAVSWERAVLIPAGHRVPVTCPVCGEERLELAKSVRYRIRRGAFTGRCRRDSHPSTAPFSTSQLHPAVDWSTLFVRDHREWVRVACPVCQETRELTAKSVRYQVKRGIFSGLCSHDRLVGKVRSDSPDRPYSPWVDWSDFELVPERGSPGRRRALIRVHCPDCDAVRLMNPTYLRLLIKADSFRPECQMHRRSAGPRAGTIVVGNRTPAEFVRPQRRAI